MNITILPSILSIILFYIFFTTKTTTKTTKLDKKNFVFSCFFDFLELIYYLFYSLYIWRIESSLLYSVEITIATKLLYGPRHSFSFFIHSFVTLAELLYSHLLLSLATTLKKQAFFSISIFLSLFSLLLIANLNLSKEHKLFSKPKDNTIFLYSCGYCRCSCALIIIINQSNCETNDQYFLAIKINWNE